MPQYFLHLHECGTVTGDHEGISLADDVAAHEAAVEAAREIIGHEAFSGEICMNCFIVVEDALHIEVDRVLFDDAVKIVSRAH